MRRLIPLLLLATLGLALVNLRAQPSSDELQMDEFVERWNALASEWNDASIDLRENKYPLGKLQRVEKAMNKLRRSPLWPRDGK